jgi:CBS domain-containing protein
MFAGARTSRPTSRRASFVAAASEDESRSVAVEDEEASGPEPFTHGEWNATHSILNFEDIMAHYEPMMFKENAQPSDVLADIMSTTVRTARATDKVSDISSHFGEISGLPVVDDQQKVIGVVSKKDLEKSSNPNALVKDIMTTPVYTAQANGSTVSDAAVLMLKHKIHRIPVVNEEDKLVGIVTRTDVFTNLEGTN